MNLCEYLDDVITTDNIGPKFPGTIRKIKRKKGSKFEYQYAGGGDPNANLAPVKNPDGSDVKGGLLGIQSRPTEQTINRFMRKKKK